MAGDASGAEAAASMGRDGRERSRVAPVLRLIRHTQRIRQTGRSRQEAAIRLLDTGEAVGASSGAREKAGEAHARASFRPPPPKLPARRRPA